MNIPSTRIDPTIGSLARLLLAAALFLSAPAHAAPAWSSTQAETLLHWIERAPGEALALPSGSISRLRAAIDSGDRDRLDTVSNEAAIVLLRAWRGRCCGARRPAWWHIDGSRRDADLHAGLERALSEDRLDLYLRSVRPSHRHYAALATAFAQETDADRKRVIARNLARWRWMPANLGRRYLLVNIASQYVTLWEGGRARARWRVIIGKPSTRTPVFSTDVTGVVLNPWWNIPSSIAAEGIARFVRRNPAAARARGYIYQNGRYRQMPGEKNALGRMKLVMPNPYSVYLHDTSNRELFAEDRRAFSHGCVRVDRALPFAARLLARDGWTLAMIERAVASEETQTIEMSEDLPLYVTYFTAEPASSGEIRFLEDLYSRDPVVLPPSPRAGATGIYGSPPAGSSDSLAAVAGAAPCPI
jgi:L,D-transpeptidase YcbB